MDPGWKCTILISLLYLTSIFTSVDSDAATASPSSAAAPKDEVVPLSGSSKPSGYDSDPNVSPQTPESLNGMGSIIPGVFKEYLPQPVFYESVVPAIFQFHTPSWNKSEINFNNWYTCVTETVPYRFSCPVTFHMNKALVNLHVDFDGLHPISDIKAQNLQESMKQYYQRLTDHSEFCDRIQKHFAGIWTESADLQRYLNALQGCSRGSEVHPYFDRDIQDYNYGIRGPFTKMENNFYSTFYKHILGSGGKNSSLDLVASALLSNTRTGLQGTILTQFYAERNRWLHADKDCRQGYIPTSLLTSEKFNDSLSAILKMSIFHHESDLSISPGQMSKYYSLPLADCTHTQDSYVVRVLIPILKKFRGQILQLVHIHNIPFQYKDHICSIKLPNRASSSNPDSIVGGHLDPNSMFLYNELTHRAYRTNCKPNELCKISEYMLDIRRSDPCVSSLLSRNDTGIRTFCDFECLPKDDYILPAVVRVASNKFVVTGSPLDLRVVCGRLTQNQRLIHLGQDHVGAMLIKLPCHCRLIFPHFNVFYGSTSTCDLEDTIDDHPRIVHADEEQNFEQEQELEISSIIPFMFAKVRSKAAEQQQQHREKNANSVNHIHQEENEEDKEYYFYDNLAEGLIINLTEVIDTERIENYIKSSEIRRARQQQKFKGMDFYAEKLINGESLDEHGAGGSGGGVGVLFWTIFIISVVLVLTLQIYIIVMFKRNERISYVKDERILYRVEPEPDDAVSLG